MSETMGSVFANSGIAADNGGGGDLLQQAFQQIDNEEEEPNQQQQQQQQHNNLLEFLQNSIGNTGVPQVIQLTPEQAAALGINVNELENSVTIEQEGESCCEDEIGYRENGEEVQQQQQLQLQTQSQTPTQQLSQEDTQRVLDELTQSGLLKTNQDVVFKDWTAQNGQTESYNQSSIESNLMMESIVDGDTDRQTNQIEEQTSNFFHIQTIGSNEQSMPKDVQIQCNDNLSQNTIQFSIASSNPQPCSSLESQSQILQRFPMILPSSQFIIKPAQTVLTPVKNFRILQSAPKVSTNAQTSQNSLLLPKTTFLNTMSPQLIKAVPMGTQFIDATGNISTTQLLTASQIFSKANSISSSGNNQTVINDSIVTTSVNSVPTVTQHLIRQTSAQRPAQKQVQQKANLQKFFTPILKSTANSIAVVKNTSLLNSKAIIKQNGSSNSGGTTTIYKSINPSMLKVNAISSPVAISLSTTKSANNSQVIFKTTPVMKTNDILKSSPTIVRTQISGTPVSILKPQAKAVNNNNNTASLIKQNLTSLLAQKTNALSKPLELNNGLKPLVTAKLKQSVNSIMKSIKKKPITKLIPIGQSGLDGNNKPLGSCENPIKIVQQGDTYHSVNRLTQAQLKQIAQALQQRTQESVNPNEKVVYRLTFHDEAEPRMKNSSSLLKSRNSKRGRPRKSNARSSLSSNKSAAEEDHDDSKDDRGKKNLVARTRSGRLSRPPRHMVRDYKHLHHHVDLTQDDSDGGFSDHNNPLGNNNNSGVGDGLAGGGQVADEETAASVATSNASATTTTSADDGQRTELLAGLEMTKRKVSDDFRCPTCNKIYFGRTRMAKHFESNPDHGSLDQMPPLAVTADTKPKPTTAQQDPLRRKGKKRGPWAYTTPEAKSERRQLKLREAMSACENSEVAKIAAKPVLSSMSLFDVLLMKSDNNVRNFLSEIKELVERVRDKTSTMLSAISSDDKLEDNYEDDDVVELGGELLCDVLGLNSGFYRVNEPLEVEEAETEERSEHGESFVVDADLEPPLKIQKTEHVSEEVKENIEESGYSENSDLSAGELFNERRSEPPPNCPEVLSALTLVPRCSSSQANASSTSPESDVPNDGVADDVEIPDADTPGFQKLSINAETKADPHFIKEGTFTKLGDSLESNSCSDVFTKFNGNFDQSKMDSMQRTFIKLEPTEEGFIKLENGMLGGFHEGDFGKIQSNGFNYVSGGISDNFAGKGFRKLIPSDVSPTPAAINKQESLDVVDNNSNNSNHTVSENSIQITTTTTNSNDSAACASIFESNDNLDIEKMSSYDHMEHLDILNGSGVIDDKLVEHLQLVDNANIVDELVSERLKSIMPESLLDSGNLLQHNGHLDADLDFEELSEEFNRNTRS